MVVYLVMLFTPYEGREVLDVKATLESAIARATELAEKDAASMGLKDLIEQPVTGDHIRFSIGLEEDYDYFEVHEWEVA